MVAIGSFDPNTFVPVLTAPGGDALTPGFDLEGAFWSAISIRPGRLPRIVQIVGYDSGLDSLHYDPLEGRSGAERVPALLLAEDGEVRTERLSSGHRLEYELRGRHCAGTHDGTVHESCEEPTAPYCSDHESSWPCAKCTGRCEKPIDACDQEHAVYLAAFAPATFKVGVTRLWRLPARLREQGADRAAHIRTVSDGRIARRVERELARSVPDRVGVSAKLDGLHRDVDGEAWHSLLGEYDPIECFELEYGLSLAERPMQETLATGTVLGTKGRVLVLEYAGNRYAVDLRSLVGHDVRIGGPSRKLQTGLGAFR